MSLLRATTQPPLWAAVLFNNGADFVKQALAEPEVAYNLTGQLYLSKTGWLLLSVPNSFARGVFSAMQEPGIELPTDDEGAFNAHVSVMRPEELSMIGGGSAVTERGKQYRYTLGRIYTVEPTDTTLSKVWFVKVHSPELQELRRSYGLSSLPNEGKFAFHVTVAVRRRKVLGRNEARKQS